MCSLSTVWYHCLSHIDTLMSLGVTMSFLYFHLWKAPRVKFCLQATFCSFSAIRSVLFLAVCLSYLPTLASEHGYGSWLFFLFFSFSYPFLPLLLSLFPSWEISQGSAEGSRLTLFVYLINKKNKIKKSIPCPASGHNHLTALLEHCPKKPQQCCDGVMLTFASSPSLHVSS